MSDWPGQLYSPANGTIHPFSWTCIGPVAQPSSASFNASGTWPSANRAIYIPFQIETEITAFQMAVYVGTQSGNLDVGIYDVNNVRLVSTGSTAVGAAGIQLLNIADTTLSPGYYYMALCVDNTTAAFRRITQPDVLTLEVTGVQTQDVGAVTLPNPSVFANPPTAYLPLLTIATKSTV